VKEQIPESHLDLVNGPRVAALTNRNQENVYFSKVRGGDVFLLIYGEGLELGM